MGKKTDQKPNQSLGGKALGKLGALLSGNGSSPQQQSEGSSPKNHPDGCSLKQQSEGSWPQKQPESSSPQQQPDDPPPAYPGPSEPLQFDGTASDTKERNLYQGHGYPERTTAGGNNMDPQQFSCPSCTGATGSSLIPSRSASNLWVDGAHTAHGSASNVSHDRPIVEATRSQDQRAPFDPFAGLKK
jgi:hypothetical protein